MEAPAIVQGSLAIGYRSFSALDPETPDFSGVVVQGSLTHTIGERTKVELTLSRDVQYSFEETEPYYLTTGFRVVVTQQLGNRSTFEPSRTGNGWITKRKARRSPPV
jgi:hypothetical protein